MLRALVPGELPAPWPCPASSPVPPRAAGLGWAGQGVQADGALVGLTHALINVFSPFCCFIGFTPVAQTPASFKSEGVAALVQIAAAVF